MLRRKLTLLALLALMIGPIATGASGQESMTAKPQSNDAELTKKVDAFLAQWDKNDMPGCAVGAIKDGKLVYKRAVGLANLDYDVPNTTTTLFTVASASKPFTAMSINLLAQQGKLSLDDDIRKYLPEIPQYSDTITIRHMLHHTSGIREYQALLFFGGLGTDNAYSEKAILSMIARQKNISFKPGSKYQYSNSNYQLLGMIVARVSGKSLRAFADENIFKPLGMKHTLFFDDRFEVIKNRATGYRVGPDKSIKVRSSLFSQVGGGGLLTTIEDLYLWDQNFYEPKVGSKELISQFTAPITLNNGEKTRYGHGVFLGEYKGLRKITHSGNMTGFRAQMANFPDQKFTAIALCNNMAILPPVIIEKLADIYLDGQFKTNLPSQKNITVSLPTTVALTEQQALRYAGTYAHAESGNFFKLRMKDGKLVNGEFFKKELVVTAASENRLLISDGNGMTELLPVVDEAGAISEIRVLAKNGRPDVYLPMKPALGSQSEYAGTFHSDEFDADWVLVAKGNGFVLQIGESFEAPLTPAYLDVFTTGNGQINLVFNRDDKGKIMGFVFNSALDERDVKGVAFRLR